MRNSILFIGLILLSCSALDAQYLPTINDNSEWNTYSWFEIAYNTTFQISGETVINDTTYKNLYYDDFDLLREDTLSKSIYQRLYGVDFKIYDFSLNVGDTFLYDNPMWGNEDIYMVLDSITDTIYSFDGNYLQCSIDPKRVFYFHNATTPFVTNIVWVEGIGSLAGILFPWHDWRGGNDGETLLCHFNDSGARDFHYIYYEEPNPCQGFVGITETEPNNSIQIFPNPTSDSYVNVCGAEIESIQMVDFLGNKLIEVTNTNHDISFKMNIVQYPSGVYLIRVYFSDQSSAIWKFIIL